MSGLHKRVGEVLERAPQGGTVIEVGALRGEMAHVALSRRPDLRWIMIDNWLPGEEQPEAYRATGDSLARRNGAAVMKHAAQAFAVGIESRASILFMSSMEAAQIVAERSVNIVFIDGDHSCEAVKSDIAAWSQRVRRGGWIGGHDFEAPEAHLQGVTRAVTEAFGGLVGAGEDHTWWVRL